LVGDEGGDSRRVELLRRSTRQRGLGCVEGDLLPGVASLSAPVFNHQGDLVAAISTLGPQGDFDTDPNGPIGTTLKATANKLSVRLGCNEKTNIRMTSAVRIPSRRARASETI
jgi:DNA-binding IclR family transcriptional regulator